MQFLVKSSQSEILQKKLTYRKNSSKNNATLKKALLEEQKNFCAYTERYIQPLDATEVEHFDSSKKYKDDYYNYYAVLRSANLYKKDEKYVQAGFLESLFFQDQEQLNQRISYHDGLYIENQTDDQEAAQLIDFLGLNHPALYTERARQIRRLKQLFADAAFDKQDILDYFNTYLDELSFITAIENELDIKLMHLI